MRVVLTGGGTGGHLTPLVAVTAALRALAAQGLLPPPEPGEPDLEVLYQGVVSAVDQRVLDAAGIPYRHVPSGKVRRYLTGVPHTVVDLLVRLPLGVVRALWALFFLMPDVVLSKGGYGSIPTVIAAFLYRIPVLLHETDTVSGVANQWLARFASAIAVSFRQAESSFPPRKVFVSGTPLHPAFQSLPERTAALRYLGLHEGKPVLFVTGGSQGAQRINTALLAILPSLLPEVQILHQVGEANLPAIADFVAKDLRHLPEITDYHAVGSLTAADMAAAYAASDLVLGRAGGTTLAEIAAAGKPSILIPLSEAAQAHQWENAYFFREQGAAVVLGEANLPPPIFLSTIRQLLENPQNLRLMADRVRALHAPHAAETVARVLVEMAQGRIPGREVARAALTGERSRAVAEIRS